MTVRAAWFGLFACGVAVTALGQGDRTQTPDTDGNPALRGWLLETLHLDATAARAAYERGAEAKNRTVRRLSVARLADLDHHAGDAASARARLQALRDDGVEGLEMPPGQPAEIAREFRAARDLADASARAAKLRDVRDQLVTAERSTPPSRSILEQTRASIVESLPRRSSAPLRRAIVSVRRDWLAIVERHLAGDHDSADRLAWFHLGWQPQPIGTDPASYAAERLARIRRRAGDPSINARERTLLQQIAARAQSDIDADAVEKAAELLRRIPLRR